MRRSFLAAERGASCDLARVEVIRLARTRGSAAFEQARRVVEELYLVRLDDAVLDAAAVLPVPGVRMSFASASAGQRYLAGHPQIHLLSDNGDGSASYELSP